jgi:hypothetical protein
VADARDGWEPNPPFGVIAYTVAPVASINAMARPPTWLDFMT